MSADLAYKGFVAKCAWLSETRWTEAVINACVEISMIDCLIHHCDKDTLFAGCILHKLPFIRLRTCYMPIYLFGVDYIGTWVSYWTLTLPMFCLVTFAKCSYVFSYTVYDLAISQKGVVILNQW